MSQLANVNFNPKEVSPMAICSEGIFRLCGTSSKEIEEKATAKTWQEAQEAIQEATAQQAQKMLLSSHSFKVKSHISKLFWLQKIKEYRQGNDQKVYFPALPVSPTCTAMSTGIR